MQYSRSAACVGASGSAPCSSRITAPVRWRVIQPRQQQQRHASSPIDLAALQLDMPEIDGDLKSVQRQLGAVFDDVGLVQTYGNARQAVAALEAGVVLVDRSHWGRLRVTGEGRTSFLHNQSTNDFRKLQPGQGCDTVFVTATARTLDLATALVSGSSVLLLVSPTTKQTLLQRLTKYIFPADQVAIQDISEQCAMMSLIGPEAEKVLQEVGGDALTIIGQPYGSHQVLRFKSGPVVVAVGSGLATPGYTLVADDSIAGDLFALLASKGCLLMGEREWEIARVMEGRPAPGAELTEDFNPLEAGLAHAVSISKGCYIGQETLAKVANRGAVKQRLWGLALDALVAAGTEVAEAVGGPRIGRVTSTATTPDGRHVALAYLRSKDAAGQPRDWQGAQVVVGAAVATVTTPPFVTCSLSDALSADVAGPGADARFKAAEQERQAAAAAAEAEAAAKAEKLRAMQARLAEWQARAQAGPSSGSK